jgi:hypothetical protein
MVHGILGIRVPATRSHGADCHGRMDQTNKELTREKLILVCIPTAASGRNGG